MLSDLVVSNSILLNIALILFVIAYRYKVEKDRVFFDACTYYIILTVLYVLIPAYIYIDTGKTLVGSSYSTIQLYANYSLYYSSVLTIYYIFNGIISALKKSHSSNQSDSNILVSHGVIICIYLLLIIYVIAVYSTQLPSISSLWSDRAMASLITNDINKYYKTQFIFVVIVSLVIYLVKRYSEYRFILLLMPFVVIDLITTSRGFLFQTLFIYILTLLITNKKVPAFKVLLLSICIAFFAVIRVIWYRDFQIDEFFIIPRELLNTAEATFLVIESSSSINAFHTILFAIGKVFSPQLVNLLAGKVPHVGSILASDSPLHFGLGGSLLSEAFSFKSTLMLIIYPIITAIYLTIINYFVRRFGFFGLIIFAFYLLSIKTIFRTGLIFTSMEPFYYFIYAMAWYWLLSLINKNSINFIPQKEN
ncbi:MAG: hypothetical protein ABW168_05450 [Sedimenticola sp.]